MWLSFSNNCDVEIKSDTGQHLQFLIFSFFVRLKMSNNHDHIFRSLYIKLHDHDGTIFVFKKNYQAVLRVLLPFLLLALSSLASSADNHLYTKVTIYDSVDDGFCTFIYLFLPIASMLIALEMKKTMYSSYR